MGETETTGTETTEAGGEMPRRTKRRESTSWVLQVQHANGTWEDVATVTVPSGTKRRTVLLKAAAEWGAPVSEEGVEVRLVPAEHLVVQTLRPKPQPTQPELEVI
jgi:hypothetical protein